MLDVKLLEDGELQSVCNSFISSMLPHEKYHVECLSTNLCTLFKYIHLDEFHMEYYLLLSLLNQLSALRASLGPEQQSVYRAMLTREDLGKHLESVLTDSVMDKQIDVVAWLDMEGMKSNLKIEQAREQAQQKLYARTMELYDTCFALEVDSAKALELVPTLRACLLSHVGYNSVGTQSEILQGSKRVGSKVYQGPEGWLEYNAMQNTEISNRLQAVDENSVVVLDNVAKGKELTKEAAVAYERIAEFGIGPIDDRTPMMRHRLIVLVGQENVGKTAFAIGNAAINAAIEGKKVAYVCGESTKAEIFVKMIIAYVYSKYNATVLPEHVLHPEDCPEHIQKMIGFANTFISGSGQIALLDALTYGTVYSELVAIYDSFQFDVLIIDHSCNQLGSVTGRRDQAGMTASVSSLAADVVRFKKAYPVCAVVLSHPSSELKQAIAAGKKYENSPTKYSQNLSTDADDLYVMVATILQRSQNLAEVWCYKRRNASVFTNNLILNAEYHVYHFFYDPANQASEKQASATAMSVLEDYDNAVSADLEDSYFTSEVIV